MEPTIVVSITLSSVIWFMFLFGFSVGVNVFFVGNAIRKEGFTTKIPEKLN